MFTVRHETSTPPPLARIVSSPLQWCIDNCWLYYKTLHAPLMIVETENDISPFFELTTIPNYEIMVGAD